MDSFESRMNPRFLAESEKGMLWEPRVIESGRETVEGFKEDEKGKRRASVLSSFSLSWFSVIHIFMSSVQALSSLSSFVQGWVNTTFFSLGAGHPETGRVHHTECDLSFILPSLHWVNPTSPSPHEVWVGVAGSSGSCFFCFFLPSLTLSSVSACSNNTYLSVTA